MLTKTIDAAEATAQANARYQSGFANEFATEALPGALPVGRNSPQRCPYGLYAETASGAEFTRAARDNRRRGSIAFGPPSRIDRSGRSTTESWAVVSGADTTASASLESDASAARAHRFCDGQVSIAAMKPAVFTVCGECSMVDRYFMMLTANGYLCRSMGACG